MDLSPVNRRVSVIMLQASVRRIDQDIRVAAETNDNRRIQELLERRHNVAHQIGKVLFRPAVQS